MRVVKHRNGRGQKVVLTAPLPEQEASEVCAAYNRVFPEHHWTAQVKEEANADKRV